MIGSYSIENDVPLTIHAAESEEEDRMLRTGEGFFTDVFRKFDVEWRSPQCSPIKFLADTGILKARPLLAHCVQVSDTDISIIADSGSSVAHCPRSNAKFGHGTAPLDQMRSAGIDVGLGSDSVASNNRCDIFGEAGFAALAARLRSGRARFIGASDVLFAATLGGARAIGLGDAIGSIEPGKQADLTVVSLASIAQQPITDVMAAVVFSTTPGDVAATIVAGREVFRDGVITNVDEAELKERLNRIRIPV